MGDLSYCLASSITTSFEFRFSVIALKSSLRNIVMAVLAECALGDNVGENLEVLFLVKLCLQFCSNTEVY